MTGHDLRKAAPANAAGSGFPSTHWSFVSNVREANTEERRRLIDVFLTKYMTPLRAHITRQFPQIREQDREDLLQDFITSRILQQSILDRARKERGRLRSLLRVSLNNSIKNWLAKRKQDFLQTSGDVSEDRIDLAATHDPTSSFDLDWARFVLAEAVIRFKDDCHKKGRQLLWDIFDVRVMRPILIGAEPVPYDQLSNRFGLPSKRLENLLVTARRAFGRMLREVVGAYTANDEETEQEVKDLWVITSSAANKSYTGAGTCE